MKLSTSTEWLFFHLWKKNPETGNSCPGVFIADTIIYRFTAFLPKVFTFFIKMGATVFLVLHYQRGPDHQENQGQGFCEPHRGSLQQQHVIKRHCCPLHDLPGEIKKGGPGQNRV